MPTRKPSILLPVLLLIAMAVACGFVGDMGSLAVSDSPLLFEAKGETDQYWRAAVTPGVAYEVVVTALDFRQINNPWIKISTYEDECFEDCIASLVECCRWTDRTDVGLTFVGPDQGFVYIHVVWAYNEVEDELGTVTILLHEVGK